ncbi:hypothetical protein [Noviherbaspirillum denitrificans]|uniref:hypothetical protein n=1 Tax=Noviherbaspirillum denitrificans TaxID=1968433 RepID=UPI0011326250|nr:hypothetical protein [Noviherbaspirillum denitrificans]
MSGGLALDDLRTVHSLPDDKHVQNMRAEGLVAELKEQLEELRNRTDNSTKARKPARAPRKSKTA